MFTTSFLSVRLQVVSSLAFCALAIGMVGAYAPAVSAQTGSSNATLAELQAMVAKLMAQIVAMQGGVTTTPTVEVFAVGSAVQPTANVRVRSFAGTAGVILGTVTPGSIGVVDAGPVKQGGVNWYRVSFKTSLSGWVAGTWLKKVSNQPVAEGSSVTFSLSANSPEASTIVIDGPTEATVLAFEIEVAGENDSGEIEFKQLAVSFVTNGATFDEVVEDVFLRIDGQQFNDVEFSTLGAITVAKFDLDGDFYLEPDETTEVEVVVSFEDNLTGAATLQASVGEYARQLTIAAAEKNITNLKGMAIGDVHSIVPEGGQTIEIASVDTESNTAGQNSEIGQFTIEFEVTALDEDAYIKNTTHRTGTKNAGVKYGVDGPSEEAISATLNSTADVVNGGVYKVSEGETEKFTLAVSVTTTVAGQFRVSLDGISYSDEPTGMLNLKHFTTSPVSDFRTPYELLNVGGVQSTAKIDSFTVTPSSIRVGGGIPVTFTWKSTGTTYCYIVENINGTRNNLGLSDLLPEGTKTYAVPDRYVTGTVVSYELNCQDASTGGKDKIVQATTKLNITAGKLFVDIADITTGSMPTISGTSEEMVKQLSVAIAGSGGDKVYGSGDITVNKGKWSHKVNTKLENGNYEVVVYINNKEVARKSFIVVPAKETKPELPDCVKGKSEYSASNGRTTAGCPDLLISTSTPIISPAKCMWQSKYYTDGTKKPSTDRGFLRSSSRIMPLTCQNGEWKPVAKPAMQTGVGSSTATTTRYGSVRGASTDILSEISVTLTIIENILADLK